MSSRQGCTVSGRKRPRTAAAFPTDPAHPNHHHQRSRITNTRTRGATTVRKGINSRAALIAAIQASRRDNDNGNDDLNGADEDERSESSYSQSSSRSATKAGSSSKKRPGTPSRRNTANTGTEISVMKLLSPSSPPSPSSNRLLFVAAKSAEMNKNSQRRQTHHYYQQQQQREGDNDEDSEEHRLMELQRIARCKRENHLKAAQCLARLYEGTVSMDVRTTRQLPIYMQPGTTIQPNDFHELLDHDEAVENIAKCGNSATDNTATSTNTTTSTPASVSIENNNHSTRPSKKSSKPKQQPRKRLGTAKQQQFLFDPLRKWPKEFFVDPLGSRPPPNDDAVERQKYILGGGRNEISEQIDSEKNPCQEKTNESDGNPSRFPRAVGLTVRSTEEATFFRQTEQPYTNKEKIHLARLLSPENLKNVEKFDSPEKFYNNVANELNKEYHSLTIPAARLKADCMMLPTNKPRTGRAVYLYHQDRVASQYNLSREDSDAIANIVSPTMCCGSTPDWNEIANHLLSLKGLISANESKSTSSVVCSPPPITPYRCMVHFKTKLSPRLDAVSFSLTRTPDEDVPVTSGGFTQEEDEFLLRYMAMMGPQFVWDGHQIAHLTCRLFGPQRGPQQSNELHPLGPIIRPGFTTKNLYDRTTGSMWNPLFKDSYWTKEEEQKLVIAMKIYHSSESDDGEITTHRTSTNTQAPSKARLSSIRRAAQHFFPARQPDSVSKKWERSLKPSMK